MFSVFKFPTVTVVLVLELKKVNCKTSDNILLFKYHHHLTFCYPEFKIKVFIGIYSKAVKSFYD